MLLSFRNASWPRKGTPTISRKPNTASAKMGSGSDETRFHVRPAIVCVDAGAEKVIKN